MKEKEPFDLAFQEVTRDKGGIRSKIAKTSRNLVFNYSQSNAGTVATGVAIDSLGIGSFVGAMESQPVLFLPAAILSGLGTAIVVSPLIPGWLDCLSRDEDHKRIYEKVVSTVSRVYPEWQNNPPSKEEFESFIKKVLYLPPVGGKVTLEKNSLWPTALFPALTADEKVEEIIKFRQNGELDSAYVHQLTIQGRLPDEFKYAALALIINSTYRSDWKKPFYEADWGKVAPLVHDGGNVSDINPLWRSKGRTDFLQRVATVHEPELENMEQYATPQLATRFSSDDLANAVLEQEERSRLILEINFYQRAAFGLHAKIGTIPDAVGPNVAKSAMQEWEGFVKGMDNILDDYDASKITKPRWFTKMPRLRAWGRLSLLRYEANYRPIQEALTSLEEIKSKNPSLRQEVNALMIKTTSSIDNAIGI